MFRMPNDYYGPETVDKILADEEVIVSGIRYKGRRITADIEVIITLINGLRYSTTTTLHNMACNDRRKSLPPEPAGRVITEGKDKVARRSNVPR